MLDDKVQAVMANHKPTIVGTDILVGKVVIAGRHVHCTHLDDKHVDAHDEFGKHGDEGAINLVGCHQNLQSQLQVRCCLDDLVQVDIVGKR